MGLLGFQKNIALLIAIAAVFSGLLGPVNSFDFAFATSEEEGEDNGDGGEDDNDGGGGGDEPEPEPEPHRIKVCFSYFSFTRLFLTAMTTHFSPSHSYVVPDSGPMYFSPFNGFI